MWGEDLDIFSPARSRMTSGTKTGATRRTPPDSTLATLPNRSLRDQGRRLRRTREAARTRACPRRTGRSQRWRGPQASAVSACPGRVDAASAVDRGAECRIDRAEGSGCGAAACHLHATSHGPQGTTMVSTVSSLPRSCGRRAMSDPHLQGWGPGSSMRARGVPDSCPYGGGFGARAGCYRTYARQRRSRSSSHYSAANRGRGTDRR